MFIATLLLFLNLNPLIDRVMLRLPLPLLISTNWTFSSSTLASVRKDLYKPIQWIEISTVCTNDVTIYMCATAHVFVMSSMVSCQGLL